MAGSPPVGIGACSAVAAVLSAVLMVACAANELNRILSTLFAVWTVRGWEQGQTNRGWQGKSAAFGRAHVVDGVEVLRGNESAHAVAALRNLKQINASRAVGLRKLAVRHHEASATMKFASVPDAFATAGVASRVRRALSARSCGPQRRPDMSATVLDAARAAPAGRALVGAGVLRSRLSLRSTSRRVVMKARVVRHHGARFRSAPLSKHITYLKREGVTRDGAEARMFDATSDTVDERAFAERCKDDRHHFRFIISPEDAAELGDLRTFTRELMTDVARDLGTKLDWIAVDHWNTDNPHIHVLIRGRAEDGQDLVISRDYISRGFRDRAAERVTLELGPRSEQEIRSALEREVEAERWTSLDRALRVAADEGAGVADLRPSASGEDPELRRLMVGRAARLERLGLAEQIAPGCWTLKPGIEDKLRDLSIRGDIIKTMHRAMSGFHREPDVSGFALHGDEPVDAVLGRLVERGLHDELKGSAYAIVEGIDGRTHHIRFTDIEMTGDAAPGAIVEARTYDDAQGASISRSPRDRISVLRPRSRRGERPGSTGS